MTDRVAGWIRVGVVVTLAAPQLLIGLWALVAPKGWFDSFPGFDPRVVAAEPPYNQHLVSDVGAGFFATGVALLVAVIWANRVGIQVALVAYVAFTLPHVIYHSTHPAHALSGVDNVVNSISLASGLVLAAVFARALHVGGRTSGDHASDTERRSAGQPRAGGDELGVGSVRRDG